MVIRQRGTVADAHICIWGGLLCVVMFLAAWWNGTGSQAVDLYMSDQIIVGDVFRNFMATSWANSTLFPQWNPGQFGGMPFVEAFHGSLFYPPANIGIWPPISMLGVLAFLLTLIVGWWWWLRHQSNTTWPTFAWFYLIGVYMVCAVLVPFALYPAQNLLTLWGAVGGVAICWLLWHLGGKDQPASTWNAHIAIALGLSVVIPITLEWFSEWGWMNRAHGYAFDWVAEYVRTAPPAEVMQTIGDGKAWHYSMWYIKPVMMAGWFSIVVGTLRPVSWGAQRGLV
jgi:hypothetical protein